MADTQLTQSGAQVQADLNLTENLQDAFSTSSTYAVNDIVIYDSKLYKCISAISTAGAWDSSKWTQIHLSDLGAGGGGGGTNIDLYNGTLNLEASMPAGGNSTTKIKLDTPPTSENDFHYSWVSEDYNSKKTLNLKCSAIYIWSSDSYGFSNATNAKLLTTYAYHTFNSPLFILPTSNNFSVNCFVSGAD